MPKEIENTTENTSENTTENTSENTTENESATLQALRELFEEQKEDMKKMRETISNLEKENAKLVLSQGSDTNVEDSLKAFSKYNRKD